VLDRARANLERKLPSHMVPAKLVALDELPLTPNGKVGRRALMARDERSDPGSRAPASTPNQKAILEVWCEVPGCQDSGIRDDFFQAGGNSTLAARLIQQLNERLGTRLVLQPLFTSSSTIERLAALLDGHPAAGCTSSPHVSEANREHALGQNVRRAGHEIEPDCVDQGRYRNTDRTAGRPLSSTQTGKINLVNSEERECEQEALD
jgi:hypothetical protein